MWRAAKGKEGVVVLDAELFPQTIAVTSARAESVGPTGRSSSTSPRPRSRARAAGIADESLIGVVLQQSGRLGPSCGTSVPSSRRPRSAAASSPSPRTCSLSRCSSPRVSSAPTSRSARPSASASRSSTAVRTRRSWRSARGWSACCPGRLVGVSVDADGDHGLPPRPPDPRAAHPPREGHEQHLHGAGPARDRRLDVRGLPRPRRASARSPSACTRHAATLAASLRTAGVAVEHDTFFDTVRAVVPGTRRALVARAAAAAGINLYAPDADHVQIACDETHDRQKSSSAVLMAFAADPRRLDPRQERQDRQRRSPTGPASDRRTCTHPVFHRHRSETSMLRYLRRLSDKDLALDRTMIPLGSCTMKLNATAEMEADHLAGVREHPPVRAHRPDRWATPSSSTALQSPARGDHRLRRCLGAAERGFAGRVRRPSRDPRLPPVPRRHGP